MRDIILRAVEVAEGWQFVPSHSFIKIPGLTEPADVLRVGPVVIAGLADQLISQIDKSENFSFHSNDDGRATVTNSNPKNDEPDLSSHHGKSRALNALCAMSKARFI